MSIYNSMTAKGLTLAKRYDRELVQFDDERYVIPAYSRNTFPIITKDKKIQLFQWGLIPHWLNPEGNANNQPNDPITQEALNIQKNNYNALDKDIFENPSFKESILKRRCIIPSTGYMEYHYYTTKIKQPFYIHLKDEQLFSIAGIYDFWKHPFTELLHQTFSMIITEGNELTNWIHNSGKNPRTMPVIIPKELEEKWLDPDLTIEEIKDFFKAYDAEKMDAFPIVKEFNAPESHYNPSVLQPIEQQIC